MCENRAEPRGVRRVRIRCIRYAQYIVLSALLFLVLSPLLGRPQAARRAAFRLFDATIDTAAAVSASRPNSSAGDSLLPFISDVLPEEHTGDLREQRRAAALGKSMRVENGKWRFGTFVINNPGMGKFVLQVMLANGGVLKHSKAAAVIRVADLVLLYRGGEPGRETREIKLNGENYKGDGFVYEVHFGPEYDNVQGVYEMELWGVLDADDLRKAGAGPYSEMAKIAIEVGF